MYHDTHEGSLEPLEIQRKALLGRSLDMLESVIERQIEALSVEPVVHTLTGQFDHIKEDVAPVAQDQNTALVGGKVPSNVINLDEVRQKAEANAHNTTFMQMLAEAQDTEKRRVA